MMHMSFYVGADFFNLLFEGWNNHTDGGLVRACAVFFACSCLLEVFRELMMYFKHQSDKNPLTYARTPENIARTPEMMRSLIIPDQRHIRRRRVTYHVLRSLIHMLHYGLGLIVMLAVMSYNVWILIAVLIGSAVGYYVSAVIHFIYECNDHTAYVLQY